MFVLLRIIMTEQNKWYVELNTKLNNWLDDFEQSQLLNVNEFIEQAKRVLIAAESLPEESIKQFVRNLQYDLQHFYQQNKNDAKHSVYLALMEETLWQKLADMTDKAKVEWIELEHDLSLHGQYRTGDIIGFGILECQLCHKEYHITHCTVINDCIDCGHHDFLRKPLE